MSKKNKGHVILPNSELQIMQIIWTMARENGNNFEKITAGAMFEHSPKEIGHLKLTTVLTLLSRLMTKGFIRSEKTGRSFYYIPLIGEAEYKQTAAADFVSTVYNNDTKGLISALLGDTHLSVEDIDELKKMIESVDKDDLHDT
jgi:BlaI family penicillinase repressor